MNKNLNTGPILNINPFDELLYLERYYMTHSKEKSREELYEAFTQNLREIECEKNFLKKQIRERDLRIQLYQFSSDKLEELKHNLVEFPNLKEIWSEFELAYKIATGKNLIRFKELDQKREEYESKIGKLT